MLSNIDITYVLNITTLLFFMGLLGIVFNRKKYFNCYHVYKELLLLAVNFNFAAFSIYLDDVVGQIFVLFILTIAATESAIRFALLTGVYNIKNSIQFKLIKKWNLF